jgi:cholesterol oxidase
MAWNLAQADRRVCVLERGRKWAPGDFPRTPLQLARGTWDPSAGLHGLFDFWAFRGLGAVVSSGLGGGSLIYANVILPKDATWFAESGPGGDEPWPVSREQLDPHYEIVQEVLQPTPYPGHLRDRTPKTLAFHDAAERMGHEPFSPPLAVTFPGEGEQVGLPFGNPTDNVHRAQRFTCRLVGACDAGCNFGAKNSLDFTYLSAAERFGAEIRCRHEVKAFERRDGLFRIEVADYTDAEANNGAPVRRVFHARRLILSAGALGSTYLLLKNRSAFPTLSDQLGTRFTGNGDFIAFARRSRETIEPSIGPVITAAFRMPDSRDVPGAGPGHYVQDGGYPAIFAWVGEVGALPRILWSGRRALARLGWGLFNGRPERNLSAEAAEIFGDPRLSAGTMTLLAMGREPVQGRMGLRDGLLDVDWSFRRARPYFEHVRQTMAGIAGGLGAELPNNPLWKLNAVVSSHPLGGCPMGATAAEGVVDPDTGEVHGCEGLHVADGSVLPGTVGTNPSFTIAAVADRFAKTILDRGLV